MRRLPRDVDPRGVISGHLEQIDEVSAMDALRATRPGLEVSFTADCIICDRPVIDHTWRHPMTMLDHYVTQLVFRGP